MRKVRIKGTDIYLKCYDVCLTYPTGLNCEYLNGPRKGKEITISGDCVVEECVEDIPQVINTGEKIILNALKEAAFMGYDKDDDESEEMLEQLAKDTAAKLKG